MRDHRTRRLIVGLLQDGRPRTQREIAFELGLDRRLVNAAIFRAWESGAVLRSKETIFDSVRFPKGPLGLQRATAAFHKYTVPQDSYPPNSHESSAASLVVVKDGLNYVGFSREHFDHRSRRREEGEKSKAKLVIEFLRENKHMAWFSTQISEKLKGKGIKVNDVMPSIRRHQRKGLVLVRGYNTENSSTPFRQGFLLTWIDQDKPLEQAIAEAYERTDAAYFKTDVPTPLVQRIHLLRSLLIEASMSKDLLNPDYLQRQLKCSRDELEVALRRGMQLYQGIKEVKLFNVFRYYYHSSFAPEDLNAAVEMKKNYVRQNKGRESRIGHNWEAACEFFVDKFTTGARFWTQSHRARMDPRRITLHLIKPVGHRISNAEVDRVWEVSAGIFSPPTTYVLECKWGLVTKKYIDDFFEVLRWSTDFGADSNDGRTIKQGIVGVFAGSTFNPRDVIMLKDGAKLSLPKYAERNNIKILKAVDFNRQLAQIGVPKNCTVQKICRAARDEQDVKRILGEVWAKPGEAEAALRSALEQNTAIYDLEALMSLEEEDAAETIAVSAKVPAVAEESGEKKKKG
jgi:hypothetical protein